MKSDISLRRNLFNSISETPRKILGEITKLQKYFLFHSPRTHVFISMFILSVELKYEFTSMNIDPKAMCQKVLVIFVNFIGALMCNLCACGISDLFAVKK